MPMFIAIVLIVVGVSWGLLFVMAGDMGNGDAGRPAAFGWIPIAVGAAILVWG